MKLIAVVFLVAALLTACIGGSGDDLAVPEDGQPVSQVGVTVTQPVPHAEESIQDIIDREERCAKLYEKGKMSDECLGPRPAEDRAIPSHRIDR